MFDLEAGIRSWRDRQQRTSSLSMRELDELEDHLRARVDLEVELNPALSPARAFAVARKGLGQGTVLSSEFARAGSARWRKPFMMGWAMYAASFFLPVGIREVDHGYQLVQETVFAGGVLLPQVLAFVLLPNLAMLMTIPVLLGGKPPIARCLKWVLGLAGIGAMGTVAVVLSIVATGPQSPGFFAGIARFGTGYWTWAASLAFVAVALHLRARERAPAKPKTSGRAPSQGVFE